jgi:hypothetical protein
VVRKGLTPYKRYCKMGMRRRTGGPCQEGGAENNRSGKRNFWVAQHFQIFLTVHPMLKRARNPARAIFWR